MMYLLNNQIDLVNVKRMQKKFYQNRSKKKVMLGGLRPQASDAFWIESP